MPRGNGASEGIGFARAMLWQGPVAYDYIPHKSSQPRGEIGRLDVARRLLISKTETLRDKTARRIGSGEAAIFDAYSLILDDETLLTPLHQKILQNHYSAEYAVTLQFDELARTFLAMEDDYMRQRVDDVFALRDQLMRELMGLQSTDASHLTHPTVIVAHSLSPADVAGLDLSRLEGIVCEEGGYASHMAIISRTLGIPTVVGAAGVTGMVHSGDMVALDGRSGEVWINPGEKEIDILRQRASRITQSRVAAQKFRGLPTVTSDGRRLELSANVGQLSEVDSALAADAESIGLFRTELLHISTATLPTEEEQFNYYRAMLEKLNGKAAVVRTFDDGGNTPVLPLKQKLENNPALGYRGIRMSLGRPSFFRTQLRALLRASAYGSLKVVFPMVSNMDELDEALEALSQIKRELAREGIPHDENLPVGVYIEVPSAALLSEPMAQKVDFFTIGINDLIQFTIAIDRGNPDLQSLYHAYHPSVLRLVRWTVEAAHRAGIPCNISGEVSGQENVLPLLLGIGLDGFSMNPSMILSCRRTLSRCSYEKCRQLADELLELHSPLELARRLSAFNTPG